MLRITNVILKRLPRARRSVLIENERKARKAAWLGVVDEHVDKRVDLHPPFLGACKRVFSQCLVIALSLKMCHPSYHSPSLPGACCLEVSGGSLWRSYGER